MFEVWKRRDTARRTRRAAVVALAAAASVLTGCGDKVESGGDLARACQADLEVTTKTLAMFAQIPETGPNASAESVQITRRLFQADVEKPLGEFVANVPAPIAEEAGVLAQGLREFGRTADDTVLGSEAFVKAGDAVAANLFDSCEQTKHTVVAHDYRYEGVPESVPAGGIRLRLRNEGKENHELAVLARTEGVDQTWAELLRLPVDELLAKTRLVAVDDADPGREGYASGLLEPGEYLVACFVPQGTPSGTAERGGGPPHHELGMHQVLKVVP